jgi:hypothetical protein
MKPTAILFIASRGLIVDEAALSHRRRTRRAGLTSRARPELTGRRAPNVVAGAAYRLATS